MSGFKLPVRKVKQIDSLPSPNYSWSVININILNIMNIHDIIDIIVHLSLIITKPYLKSILLLIWNRKILSISKTTNLKRSICSECHIRFFCKLFVCWNSNSCDELKLKLKIRAIYSFDLRSMDKVWSNFEIRAQSYVWLSSTLLYAYKKVCFHLFILEWIL